MYGRLLSDRWTWMVRVRTSVLVITAIAVLSGCAGNGGQGQPGAPGKSASITPLFVLADCLGKDFANYEKTLGKPASKDTQKGEERVYKGGNIAKAGASEVLLSQAMTKHVDYIRIVLKPGTTWQQALPLIGVDPKSVTAIDASGETNGKPFSKTMFTGINVKNVPMAPFKTQPWKKFGKGYGVSFGVGTILNLDHSSAYGKSAILQIEYVPYD